MENDRVFLLSVNKTELDELNKIIKLYVEYDNEYATHLIADLPNINKAERDIVKYQVNNILDSINTLSDVEKKVLELLSGMV